MNFHLNYEPKKPDFDLSHQSQLLLIGSCFSTNISTLLLEEGFKVDANPFGITYNPLSIFEQLQCIVDNEEFNPNLYLNSAEGSCHYQTHSSIKGENQEKLASILKEKVNRFHQKLKTTDCLIITLGSAFYYSLNNSVVANCHKQPSKNFKKELFNLNDLTKISSVISSIKDLNPKLRILFTVSPVLHLKDGLEENFLSKSTLRLLIEMLINKFPAFCNYFPSYELVNSDLRDYRFYKEDLAHPTDQAIDYVYTKFKSTYCSSETLKITKEVLIFSKLSQHKILNPAGKDLHLKRIESLKQDLIAKYPFLIL